MVSYAVMKPVLLQDKAKIKLLLREQAYQGQLMAWGGWGYVRDGGCGTGLYMSAMVRPVGRMAGKPIHTRPCPFFG